MGRVTKIIEALEEQDKYDYKDDKIILTLDEDFGLESLQIDNTVKLDEEDMIMLGPFFWREFLKREGFNISFATEIPSLIFKDDKYMYFLQVEKKSDVAKFFTQEFNNPFTAYYFSNNYEHENIIKVKNIKGLTFGNMVGWFTIVPKGEMINTVYLSDKHFQQLFTVIDFLHENNIVYDNLASCNICIKDDKVKLINFSSAKRTNKRKEKLRDLHRLALMLQIRERCGMDDEKKSKYDNLIESIFKDKIESNEALETFNKLSKLESLKCDSKVHNLFRYVNKNFIKSHHLFAALLFACAHSDYYVPYEDKEFIYQAFHLLNRIAHKFVINMIPLLAEAIMLLLSSYYGYPLIEDKIDKNVYETALQIIFITKGLTFIDKYEKNEDIENIIKLMKL